MSLCIVRMTRAVQYWKRLHPFIVPGCAEIFALELCDTISTAGGICAGKLHPSCCAGAAKGSLMSSCIPSTFQCLQCLQGASEWCSGSSCSSACSSVYLFLCSLTVPCGPGTCATDLPVVLLNWPPSLFAKNVTEFQQQKGFRLSRKEMGKHDASLRTGIARASLVGPEALMK